MAFGLDKHVDDIEYMIVCNGQKRKLKKDEHFF